MKSIGYLITGVLTILFSIFWMPIMEEHPLPFFTQLFVGIGLCVAAIYKIPKD